MKEFTSFLKSGRKRARALGYPTINLEIPRDFDIEEGTYSVEVIVYRRNYQAVMHYGRSPTFGDREKILEVHLLTDFDFSLLRNYQKISVRIKKFLRKNKKFATKKELIDQIKKDINQSQAS